MLRRKPLIVEKPVPYPVERIRTIKEPINAELRKAYKDLLARHNELLKLHTEALAVWRSTPQFAAPSSVPLYYNEDTEVSPYTPDPFTDTRQDELALKDAFGLSGQIEFD